MTSPASRADMLRRAFAAILAGLDPRDRVRAALADQGWGTRGVIIAAGKAAAAMARGACDHLTAARGVVVVPGRDRAPRLPDALTVMVANHPVPDERSVVAARAVMDAVAGADAPVLALISGGASSLIALPADGLGLADKVAAIAAVQAAGVPIERLNAVRKHLSAIKGGRLAQRCPVPITTLVLSDVVGDDPSVVGSGPTVPDPTTYRDACDVVTDAIGWRGVAPAVRAHLERGAAGLIADTPDRARPGDRVSVLAGVGALVDQAGAYAHAAGVACEVWRRDVTGDVARVADELIDDIRRIATPAGGRWWIAAGEPTIAVPDEHGTGGRAQQFALLIARGIAGIEDVSVLVAGSDGVDGNSDAAGAIVDGATWAAIDAAGIDPAAALARCDASTALAAIDATIVTGPTGINHADLIIVARG